MGWSMVNSRFTVPIHFGLTLVSVVFIYELGRVTLIHSNPVRSVDVAASRSLATSVGSEAAAEQSSTGAGSVRTTNVASLNRVTLAFAASRQLLYSHAPAGSPREPGSSPPTYAPSALSEVEPPPADPVLVTESDSTRALALESVSLTTEPFSLVSAIPWSLNS